MLKVDFHTHTADDPIDRIPYSTKDLIDRAADLDYDALAITLHERQLDVRGLQSYAAERGIVLIPGIERTIEGKHVLLINFAAGTEDVNSFEDLARLKRRASGLVIAPHPFFPSRFCVLNKLQQYADLFDAVEYNAMFTSTLNFNRLGELWARRHGKPMVGNGDVHRLRQLGTTYSLVDAAPDADAICEAVAAGRVVVEANPLWWSDAAAIMADLLWGTSDGRQALTTPASDSTSFSLRPSV
jgi:predicted metal-dependent phosphoesterase TrpH